MLHSKKIGALLVGLLLAGLCACQPGADAGLDAAMSAARAGAVSRVSSSASLSSASSSSGSDVSSAVSSEAPVSSAPAEEGPTTAELAAEIEIPVNGDKITEDPAYIPTEEEMAADDPQYNQPTRGDGDGEEIVDTLPDLPPATSSGMGGSSSQLSSAPVSSAVSATSEESGETSDTPPADGWYEKDGDTYFYVGGQPVTGWQTSGGYKYYFNDKGVLSSKRGIDVSVYQGNIDWDAVKASGVDFVMIRVGYRGYGQAGNMRLDTNFVQNIEGAQAAGLDCGVYFFSQAITREEAVEEAKFVLEALKGYTLTYPVAFDTEYYPLDEARTNQAGLTDADRTDFAIDFCETIRAAGYYPTIYAGKSWLLDDMEISRLADWDIWLAHYTNQTDFQYPYQMWQYSDAGQVSGISGNVDLNVGLKDYASVIETTSAANLALTATAAASSTADGYAPAAAIDGWASGGSRWAAETGDASPWLELDFGKVTAFNEVWIGADISGGEPSARYALEYWDGEDWQTVLSGTGLGFSRRLSFPNVYAQKVRLHVLDKTAADGGLSVWEFAVYLRGSLSEIQVGDYRLPGFSSTVTDYTLTLPAGVQLPVTALPADEGDTCTVEMQEDRAVITVNPAGPAPVVYTLAFQYLDDPAALEVYNRIEALPDTLTETDYAEAEALKAAYDALSAEGQAAIYNLPRLTAALAQIPQLGDLNLDGSVNIQDVMAACRILARQAGGGAPGEEEIKLGDTTGDGVLDIQDVMGICKIVARQA